nr:unnamed protein product [Spirometra erinaceieuropaei]
MRADGLRRLSCQSQDANNHLMTLRLPFQEAKFTTIICASMTDSDDVKNTYENSNSLLATVPRAGKLFSPIDIGASVGTDHAGRVEARGTIPARVVLNRLTARLEQAHLSEAQCGFCKRRGTTDTIFVSSRLQKKCRSGKDLQHSEPRWNLGYPE